MNDALSIHDTHSRSEITDALELRIEWIRTLFIAASDNQETASVLCDLGVWIAVQCEDLAERWSALDVEIRKAEAESRIADEQAGHDPLTFGDQSKL